MKAIQGSYITPKVRLVRPLDEGGMGSVWVADHLGLDSHVAVKFISPELLARTPAAALRFKREASAAARLKSPHVVRMFDHGLMADGTPYIVMELLRGESLGNRLSRTGILSLRDTGLVVTQVAKTLHEAHRHGIVHRDIKPDNLFLVDTVAGTDDELHGEPLLTDLFVKILDFGVAKQPHTSPQSRVTATGAMVGTPMYMSPEQVLSAHDVDFRVDLWALAVVAYEAITGRLPFEGETLGAVFRAITHASYTPTSDVREMPSPALDEWFERAFQLEPSERFDSAIEMARAFLRATAADHRGAERRPHDRGIGAREPATHDAGKRRISDHLSASIEDEPTHPAHPVQSAVIPVAARAGPPEQGSPGGDETRGRHGANAAASETCEPRPTTDDPVGQPTAQTMGGAVSNAIVSGGALRRRARSMTLPLVLLGLLGGAAAVVVLGAERAPSGESPSPATSPASRTTAGTASSETVSDGSHEPVGTSSGSAGPGGRTSSEVSARTTPGVSPTPSASGARPPAPPATKAPSSRTTSTTTTAAPFLLDER